MRLSNNDDEIGLVGMGAVIRDAWIFVSGHQVIFVPDV